MRHIINSLCLLSLGMNVVSRTAVADSVSEQAVPKVNIFQTSDNVESRLATAVKSQRTSNFMRRHAGLIAPSASRIGTFRGDTLGGLCSPDKSFRKDHQVFFVAVDSTFKPLSEDFAEMGSREFDAAIQKLSDRTPRGATDLSDSLRNAIVLPDADVPVSCSTLPTESVHQIFSASKTCRIIV